MKKVIAVFSLLITACVAHAGNPQQDRMEIFRIVASLLVLVFVMVIILTVLKRVLDNRLKNKIVDKGISEGIAASVLKPVSEEDKHSNVKWFFLLAGLGIGLMGVNYTQPVGYHSLGIMAFAIAAGFLGYHFFLRTQKKE